MPYVDFSALKERVSIEQAAHLLGLDTKPAGSQLRAACPACQSGGDRALVLTPAKGLFFCFPSKSGGDCIKLVSHCLGVGQHDAALYLDNQLCTEQVPVPDRVTVTVSKERATPPQKPEGRTAQAQPPPASREFDPESYASKLTFNEQVAALGMTEEDAARFQIGFASTGFHRGRVVFPIRHPSGEIAGFAGYDGTSFKFPTKWLPAKVVQLKRA